MKTFLKSIDYFSRKFTFTYKGKDKYNTILGGCVTIIALIIIVFNAWLIGKDIYLRENPLVVGYEEALPFHPTTRINYEKAFFGFFISDTLNNPFEDESVLRIIPLIYTNFYNEKGELKYRERFLELTDCPSEFQRLNLNSTLSESVFKPIKCIKNFDEILSGFWTDTHVSYLMFKAYRCTNETIVENSNLENEQEAKEFSEFENNLSKINLISINNGDNYETAIKKLITKSNNNNNLNTNNNNSFNNNNQNNKNGICKRSAEINKIIPTLFFNFFYTSVVINSKNFTDPIFSQISEDWFNLGSTIFKTIDYYFQNVIVRTDDGYIFSEDYKDVRRLGYYKHLADFRSLDELDANIFWLNIYITNQVKYLTREYIKVQNIFANLGGIIQVVIIFFKLLFNPYFQKKINLKIINELFDFDDALISGITDAKVVKRSNVRRIDSLLEMKGEKPSKDRKGEFCQGNSKIFLSTGNNNENLNIHSVSDFENKNKSNNLNNINLNNNNEINYNNETSNKLIFSNAHYAQLPHLTDKTLTNPLDEAKVKQILVEKKKEFLKIPKNETNNSSNNNITQSNNGRSILDSAINKSNKNYNANSKDCNHANFDKSLKRSHRENLVYYSSFSNHDINNFNMEKEVSKEKHIEKENLNKNETFINNKNNDFSSYNLNVIKKFSSESYKSKFEEDTARIKGFSNNNHSNNKKSKENSGADNCYRIDEVADSYNLKEDENLKLSFKGVNDSYEMESPDRDLQKEKMALETEKEQGSKPKRFSTGIENMTKINSSDKALVPRRFRRKSSKDSSCNKIANKDLMTNGINSIEEKTNPNSSTNLIEKRNNSNFKDSNKDKIFDKFHIKEINSDEKILKLKKDLTNSNGNFNCNLRSKFNKESDNNIHNINGLDNSNQRENNSNIKFDLLNFQREEDANEAFNAQREKSMFVSQNKINDINKSSKTNNIYSYMNSSNYNNKNLNLHKNNKNKSLGNIIQEEINNSDDFLTNNNDYNGKIKQNLNILNDNNNHYYNDNNNNNKSNQIIQENNPLFVLNAERSDMADQKTKHGNNININTIQNNLFYIKPNNAIRFRSKRFKLRNSNFAGSELEKKIDEVVNIKQRKLKFKNCEIFNSFYCNVFCRSKVLNQKNILYQYAHENLNQFTDYLENLKNFQDLTKIKYVLFSTEQILSFPFLSNPKKMKVGIHHEIQEYARAFDGRLCKKDSAIEVFNYFNKKIQNETLDGFDKKIWNIFDPKMKSLFITSSYDMAGGKKKE